MSQPEIVGATDGTQVLNRISTAVGIILWAVLTELIVWPVAAVIAGIRDLPLLSFEVMTWAAAIAAVLAFLACRMVFPATYSAKS